MSCLGKAMFTRGQIIAPRKSALLPLFGSLPHHFKWQGFPLGFPLKCQPKRVSKDHTHQVPSTKMPSMLRTSHHRLEDGHPQFKTRKAKLGSPRLLSGLLRRHGGRPGGRPPAAPELAVPAPRPTSARGLSVPSWRDFALRFAKRCWDFHLFAS